MGRKKIEIRRLADDRNRQVTFLKRKAGLMKKAWELSVLCSADVAVIVFSQNDKAFEFCSSSIDDVLIRYTEHKGPIEHKDPADFAAAAAADSGNPLPDSDDGEDDGEEEPAAKKGKKTPAPKGGKKPPANGAAAKKQSTIPAGPSHASGSPSSLDQASLASSLRPSASNLLTPSSSSQNGTYNQSTIVPPQQPPMSQLHSSSHPHPPQGRYGQPSYQQPTWQQQQSYSNNGISSYGGVSYGDQSGPSGSGGMWADGALNGANGARQSSGTPQPMMGDSMFRGQHSSAPSPFGSSSLHNQPNALNFLFNNPSSSSSNPQSYYSSEQLWNSNGGYNSGLLHSQLLQQQQYLQQQVQQTQQQNQQHPLYSHPMLLAAAAAAAAVQNGPGTQRPNPSMGGAGGFSWPITGGPSTNGSGVGGLGGVGDGSSGSNLPSVSTTTNEDLPEWQSGSPLLPDGDFGHVKHEDGDDLGSGAGGDSASEEDEDGGDDDGDDDYVEGGKRRKSAGGGGDKRARVE